METNLQKTMPALALRVLGRELHGHEIHPRVLLPPLAGA